MEERRESISNRLESALGVVRNDKSTFVTRRRSTLVSEDERRSQKWLEYLLPPRDNEEYVIRQAGSSDDEDSPARRNSDPLNEAGDEISADPADVPIWAQSPRVGPEGDGAFCPPPRCPRLSDQEEIPTKLTDVVFGGVKLNRRRLGE